MSRTFKLTVAYDGTDYAGWQIQPGCPTIQSCLESAFKALTASDVRVIGSGRTDAGVHALGQVASCFAPAWRATAAELGRALNTKLPRTISVLEVVDAPQRFHAIRDAIGKRYRYQIQVGGVRDVFADRYCWHLRRPLDIEAMRAAACQFVGEHDFASFQATGSVRKSTVRNLRGCEVIVRPCTDSERPGSPLSLVAIEVEANGFLYNMVRNIVGTLIEVGRGRQPAEWVGDVLRARDRNVAGPTAPAHALFLQRVDYAPFAS